MKKGVIFDMDGLLFDTEQIWQANWNRRAAELGFEMDPEFKYNICGTSGQLMVDVITRFFPDADAEDFIRTVKQRVAEDVRKGVPEMPGLHEIIAYFHKNGLKLAVASSSDKDIIRNNLSKSDVLQYFDVLVSGQEVEHGKPAPDIFLLAARELGLDPADCYVFEDGINGVEASLAAGCATIMIPDLLKPNENCKANCAGIFESLTAAMEAIERGDL